MKICLALAACAVLALSLVASPASAEPATTTVERFVIPLDQIQPPHHDCITETVAYSGFYELTIITTYNAAGGVTRSLHYRQAIYGTGLTTGNSYVIRANYSEVVHNGQDGELYVETFPISYIELGEGGVENYLATGVLHLTVNASGEPVSSFVLGSIRCVG
jgi:hypothetical protein